MDKKHIESLELSEIDYAVAVAQGWKKQNTYCGMQWVDYEESPEGIDDDCICHVDDYHPTVDQYQCGDLIDKFHITTVSFLDRDKKFLWKGRVSKGVDSFMIIDKSRLVAACKAFLLSKYPDAMVEVV